jgi:hypothetical protein
MAVKKVTDLRPLDGGGEPPDMDQRITNLERDVSDIKVLLARIEGRFDTADAKFDSFATKTELAQMETRIIKWNVGTLIAVGALVFAVIRFAGG